MNESTWIQMGDLAEKMGGVDQALSCYLHALYYNPYNSTTLRQVAGLYEWKGQYQDAVEIFERLINLDNTNSNLWGALGHCLVKMNKPQRAYTAYQQALFTTKNPRDPTLWYGIGLLYEQACNWEHAAEIYNALLRTRPPLPFTPEIWLRCGLVYKSQGEYQEALNCFQEIVSTPPPPLTPVDILCQCAAIYEEQEEYESARGIYERALSVESNNPTVLQRYGWTLQFGIRHPETARAVQALENAVVCDPTDALSHYLLGRCYLAQREYSKAYDSYQRAVNNNPNVPAFWGSIGILYFTTGQFRDALDAYSRAIRSGGGAAETQATGAVVTVPGENTTEVWYDLGTLYDLCNQNEDAIDAFRNVINNPKLGPLAQEFLADIEQRTQAGIRRPGVEEGEPPCLERNGKPLFVEPDIMLPKLPEPEFEAAFRNYSLLPPSVVSLLRDLESMQRSFEPAKKLASQITRELISDAELARRRRAHRPQYRARNSAVIVITEPPACLANTVATRAINPPPPPDRPTRRRSQRPKTPYRRHTSAIIAAAGMQSSRNGSSLKQTLPFIPEKPAKRVFFP